MKSLVYHGPRQLAIEERDIPEPGPNEALIRVEAVGICGSELEGYLGHSGIRVPPLVMGHEFCGSIVRLGDNVNGLSIGTKAIVNPLISCGTCDRCRIGKGNVCRSRQIVGIHRPGAFAEYVAVPAANIYSVPSEMDSNVASLAEPLAVSIHAVKLGLDPYANLMIYGAGPIGLLTLQAALTMGADRVLTVDRQPDRLAYAKRLGSEIATPEQAEEARASLFGANGVDTIIDCVGVQATREQAILSVNPGGRIVAVGLGQDQSALSMNRVVRQEVSIIGSYTYSDEDFAQAVRLLSQGKVTGEHWSTTCGLEEAVEVFAELADGKAKFGKFILNLVEGGR